MKPKRSLSVAVLCLLLMMGLSWQVGAFDQDLLDKYKFTQYWLTTLGENLPDRMVCTTSAAYSVDLMTTNIGPIKDYSAEISIDFTKDTASWKLPPDAPENMWSSGSIGHYSGSQVVFNWDDFNNTLGMFSKLNAKIVLLELSGTDNESFEESDDYLFGDVVLYTCQSKIEVSNRTQQNVDRLKQTKVCVQCDLRGTDLSGSDLSGADLSQSDLTDSNLQLTNLTGANLAQANLTDANLMDAIMKNANIEGTIFCRTETPWGEENSGC